MNITKLSIAIAMAFGMGLGTAYAQDVSPSEIQRTTRAHNSRRAARSTVTS